MNSYSVAELRVGFKVIKIVQDETSTKVVIGLDTQRITDNLEVYTGRSEQISMRIGETYTVRTS